MQRRNGLQNGRPDYRRPLCLSLAVQIAAAGTVRCGSGHGRASRRDAPAGVVALMPQAA